MWHVRHAASTGLAGPVDRFSRPDPVRGDCHSPTCWRTPEQLGMSVDPELLDRALTHRSYAYEQGGLPTNERLEFPRRLGARSGCDRASFVTYPDLSEGQLAKLRAAVVNSRAWPTLPASSTWARSFTWVAEKRAPGRDKSSILADTMEAVIGAVFLSMGSTPRGVRHHLFDPLMAEVATRGAGLDWKTSLQEIASMTGLGVPVYDVVESGPDHAKTFQPWSTSTIRAMDLVLAGTRRKPSRTPQPLPSPR